MAAISAILGLAAAGAMAATAVSSAHQQRKAAKQYAAVAKKAAKETPTYDAEKEKAQAAEQEASANKRRIAMETNTHMSSALGNTEGTTTQKKTVLGG